MGCRAAVFLRATPSLFSFRRNAYLKAPILHKRFCTTISNLEPPNVARLAQTARISLTPQQVEQFGPKIRQVVDWFGQLQDVDLQSIEPALRADTDGGNLRDDEPEKFDNRDAIIAAVPTYEDPYIKVPKVLHKEKKLDKGGGVI